MKGQKYRVIGSFNMDTNQTGVLLEECKKPSGMVRMPWYDFCNLVSEGSIQDFIMYQNGVYYCKGPEKIASVMNENNRYFWETYHTLKQ